jgi:DNA-binding response OmpR family regulator
VGTGHVSSPVTNKPDIAQAEGRVMTTIHLIETERGSSSALAGLLRDRGHDLQCFSAANEFFCQLGETPPDCVVADWELSLACGLEVVERTRRLVGDRVGIVVLASAESEDQMVAALGAGADDCICKPISDALLAARIEALLRRLAPVRVAMAKRIVRGPYALDLGSCTATVDGCDTGLAPREFDLAWTLFSQPSRLFTKSELLALIWGKRTEFGAHTISQHVYALRKKLAFDKHGFKLQSVYATGYRLECFEPSSRARVVLPYVKRSAPAASAWR